MTGEATGVHLHVEMQDISRFNWSWHASYTKSDYLDPTVFMGIDNIRLTQWIYNGRPPWHPLNKRFTIFFLTCIGKMQAFC